MNRACVFLMMAACGGGESAPQPHVASATPSPSASPSSSSSSNAQPADPPEYVSDVRTLCDGPKLAEKHLAGLDASQQARMINATLEEAGWPKSDRARAFWRDLSSELVAPKDKASKLRAEATRLGVTSCAMADFFESPPQPPVAVASGPCSGADVDLDRAFAGNACTSSHDKMPDDLLSRVAVHVDRPSVAGGAQATLVVSIENKSDAPLTLAFSFPTPKPHVTGVKNAAGADARTPSGTYGCADKQKAEAALRLADQAEALTMGMYALSGPPPVYRVTIAPKGRARWHLAWTASGRRWGPAHGQGAKCDADTVATPLAAGTYTLTVELPPLEGGKKLPERNATIAVTTP